MNKFFIPYLDNSPASIEVNGHRLLILSTEAEDMADQLHLVGGEEIRELDLFETGEDETDALSDLAERIDGGVVLAPPGADLPSMIEDLQDELPWVH